MQSFIRRAPRGRSDRIGYSFGVACAGSGAEGSETRPRPADRLLPPPRNDRNRTDAHRAGHTVNGDLALAAQPARTPQPCPGSAGPDVRVRTSGPSAPGSAI